jgi:DNA repair exonuclease SbcCD ATPase subunit
MKSRQQKKQRLESIESEIESHTKARWVLTEVAKQIQSKFSDQVENLVTSAIQSVFDRPFKFKLDFKERRNQFECEPKVIEGETELIPKDDMGGGVLDVISFAFRIVLWYFEKPRSRAVFVLDEPMKFVGKGDLLMKAGQMIKQVSNRLGIQIIMVTHEPELTEIADRAWQVTHNGKVSKVKLLTDEPKTKLIRRKT